MCYLMIEAHSEVEYVTHHIQKIVAIFYAMRTFAKELEAKGHQLHYIHLDEKGKKSKSIALGVKEFIEETGCNEFHYQLPDEWRLDTELLQLSQELEKNGVKVQAFDTEHFLTPRDSFRQIFKGKSFRMETFYRELRKKYQLLIDEDGKPWGDKWNFDSDNRKKYDGKVKISERNWKSMNVSSVLSELENIKSMGEIDSSSFYWPNNRESSLLLLRTFIHKYFTGFGDYQDAMIENDPFLFHSCLSFSLNTKQISPMEVIEAAIKYYAENKDKVSLATLEGFVRQILGWREYMRGLYWNQMPDYKNLNFFKHKVSLPSWYWTAETKMNCLKQSISQSLKLAYAHHIQRLMVIGNFSLLIGADPDDVDRWYLGVYVDAFEWVEITNTRGMSQFADGGLAASKPYVSSANYIDKMSNYCKNCDYNKKTKTDSNSCPFNSLYWHFYDRHRSLLERNPRIGMVYHTWDKLNPKEQSAIRARAEFLLKNIESL